MNRKTRSATRVYEQTGKAIMAFSEALLPPHYAAANMSLAKRVANDVFCELPHSRRLTYLNIVNRHIQAFNVLARSFGLHIRADSLTLKDAFPVLDPERHSRVAAIPPMPSAGRIDFAPRKRAVYDPC